MGRRRTSPVNWMFAWVRRPSLKVKTFLAATAVLCALVALKLFVKNGNYFFIASEAFHFVGIVVLIYKVTTKKTCSGLSLKSQELTGMYLGVRLYCNAVFMQDNTRTVLNLATLLSTLCVIYTMRFKLKSTYIAELDNTPHYYLVLACAIVAAIVHPRIYRGGSMSRILLAFSVYLESVAVVPQLGLIQNAKMIEPFTAHYVFALGVSRFFSFAHWIIQLYDGAAKYLLMAGNGYRWILMALLAEIVQTIILADFCYYYIRSLIMSGQLRVSMPLPV